MRIFRQLTSLHAMLTLAIVTTTIGLLMLSVDVYRREWTLVRSDIWVFALNLSALILVRWALLSSKHPEE